jgi:hypothetical protein
MEYPDLNFKVVYEEANSNMFGEAFISNGSCEDIALEELEYLEKYNGNYMEERKALLDLSYEDFVKSYTHDNFFSDHPYSYLDREVLNRIKDEDLGLFINRHWNDSEAASEYKRRLEGGSKIES